MRSDIVNINGAGLGFEAAVEQTKKAAEYKGITGQDAIHMMVITEEMLSMVRNLTGAPEASFWVELENGTAVMHLTAKAELDKEKRGELIAASTSRKNEAAKSFLGKLRDAFETAMASEPRHESIPADILTDLPKGVFGLPEWDGYERSILRNLADDIKISIHGGKVEMTVAKHVGEQS